MPPAAASLLAAALALAAAGAVRAATVRHPPPPPPRHKPPPPPPAHRPPPPPAAAAAYKWALGPVGVSCFQACAALGEACYPLAVAGWAGWPTTTAAFTQVLNTLPGGAAQCTLGEISYPALGDPEVVSSTSNGNPTGVFCAFDPSAGDGCGGAPAGAGARRVWCALRRGPFFCLVWPPR